MGGARLSAGSGEDREEADVRPIVTARSFTLGPNNWIEPSTEKDGSSQTLAPLRGEVLPQGSFSTGSLRSSQRRVQTPRSSRQGSRPSCGGLTRRYRRTALPAADNTYAAVSVATSQPGKTSTAGWHRNALANTLARSSPRFTRSFSIAEIVD